jgi:hypothetical protein
MYGSGRFARGSYFDQQVCDITSHPPDAIVSELYPERDGRLKIVGK